MSDALEQAATAFDAAMGNTEPQPRAPQSSEGPIETMFGDVGNLEVDDESPAKGGGDDDVDEVIEPRTKPRVEVPEEEDEDADQNDDPDADEDADQGGDEEDEEQDFYKVVVDGKEVEVGIREALDGYIRQETFHTRMNELDQVKQAIRAEAVTVLDNRKKYADLIDDMEKHLEMLVPAEPNWVDEYKRDPEGAAALQAKYQQFAKTREALALEKARVQKEQAEEDSVQMRTYIETENRKMLAMNPGWKDQAVMQRDLSMMMDTATRAGFSEEEVQNTYDSRMVAILLKAAKYDKLQANKPKPTRRGKRPMKQGAGSSRTAPKGNQAMSQLSRTGSVEDAAAVFSGILNPKRRK